MFCLIVIAFLAGVELGLILMAILVVSQRHKLCARCLGSSIASTASSAFSSSDNAPYMPIQHTTP